MARKDDKTEYTPNNPIGEVEHAMEIEEAQRIRREKRNSNISPKAARKRKEALEHEGEENARKTFVVGRRLTFGIVTTALVVLIAISGLNIMELRADDAAAEEALVQKQEEKTRLENEYAMINDLEYIEAQARERLKMIKPGEKLYIFDNQEEDEKEDI